MSGRLAAEIKQTKPFALLEEEAILNLGRTYEYLQQRLGDLLKDYPAHADAIQHAAHSSWRRFGRGDLLTSL